MDKLETISHKLVSRLVCPVTKGPLIYDKDAQILISRQIQKSFPIRDGVPILVLEEASDYYEDDFQKELHP